jgi:predicted GIY-YIG superfamily endonuclease
MNATLPVLAKRLDICVRRADIMSEVIGNERQMAKKGQSHVVYVLSIQPFDSSPKLYVGRSKQFERRLKAHKRKSTELTHFTEENGKVRTGYNVIDVIEKQSCDCLNHAQTEERRRYVELANKWGVTNVIGGV